MAKTITVSVIIILVLVTLLPACNVEGETLAVLTESEGSVLVTKSGTTNPVASSVGTNLRPGDRVQTGADSRALITFFEGSTIELESETQMEISSLITTKDSASTAILLKQQVGQTISRVTKLLDPKSRYEIETPVAVASVRGSIMLVDVALDGTTRVSNQAGVVSVTAQGLEVPIPVGSSSVVKPGQAPRLELSYDDGSPDGGYSTGGSQQYGFLVRFNPPTFPFRVTSIRIFSWISTIPDQNSNFTLRITDEDLTSLWENSFPFTMFTSEHSWVEIAVPNIAVGREFCVELYAPTLGQGLGPFIGVDQSETNTHSEIISGWQIAAWNASMPKEKSNWMIRAAGDPIPLESVISNPRSTVVSDSCGDVSDTATSKQGADLRTAWALMDADYLYVVMQLCDSFDSSLVRNYFVDLYGSDDLLVDYSIGVRPYEIGNISAGKAWALIYGGTSSFDWHMIDQSEARQVIASWKLDSGLLEMVIPRKTYGMSDSVVVLVRATDGNKDLDLTDPFRVTLAEAPH